ncbi:MAG: hypothetical protein R3C15_16755 [Thermoleophilia bacterium]
MSAGVSIAEEPGRGSRRGWWLRAAGLIALAEAVLVIADVLPAWAAIGIAIAVLASYASLRRRVAQPALRTGLRAAALSQAVVLVVPAVLVLLGWLLVAGLVVAGAVVALLILADR